MRPLKILSAFALALVFAIGMALPDDAQAKRLGGGRSFGMQRQTTIERPAATPSAPRAAAASPANTTTAPATGSRWAGPLAGLAAGLGIAALASHFGFGEGLASFITLALLGFAAFAVIGYFLRRRGPSQPPQPIWATAGAANAQTGAARNATPAANWRREPVMREGSGDLPPLNNPVPGLGGAKDSTAQTRRNIPADFDVPAFERNAKVQFIRLQAANDAGDLTDIREFTSPEIFAEIKLDIDARHGALQKTEVLTVDADVLEAVQEGARYIVSVRFTGTMREDGVSSEFDEIWHLVKPVNAPGGWVLAGMQQTG